MARTKSSTKKLLPPKTKHKQVIQKPKPFIWHVITNDKPYERLLFHNIKGDRNTKAFQVAKTTEYIETHIVTTAFLQDTIVALGDYRLDNDGYMSSCQSFGSIPKDLLLQFLDHNPTKTLVVSEEINEFIQPAILQCIQSKKRQSAFIYVTSDNEEHAYLQKTRALINWLDHHGIIYFNFHREDTTLDSITDIIAHIMSDEQKKFSCYQDIPLTSNDFVNMCYNEGYDYTNFFCFVILNTMCTLRKKDKAKRNYL